MGIDWSKKDKFLELIVAHRSVEEVRKDLSLCEGFFDAENRFVFERMIDTLNGIDLHITSFLRRSGKGQLEYLQNKPSSDEAANRTEDASEDLMDHIFDAITPGDPHSN